MHCEHGVGRGPLMACAVLVAQGHSAPEALRIVRAGRWQALPNDRQLAALLDFEREWKQSAATPPAPADRVLIPPAAARLADGRHSGWWTMRPAWTTSWMLRWSHSAGDVGHDVALDTAPGRPALPVSMRAELSSLPSSSALLRVPARSASSGATPSLTISASSRALSPWRLNGVPASVPSTSRTPA